ncbi:MAG TPA: kelch repeat-containing protein [Terriglobales bacterium]|nr:kelch repeat-containing protein [Terriglobales bacterium]
MRLQHRSTWVLLALAAGLPLAGQARVNTQGVAAQPVQRPANNFQVAGSRDGSYSGAGNAFFVAVTAANGFGQPLPGFTGTVTLGSADGSANLWRGGAVNGTSYTFAASDHGTHTFVVVVASGRLGDVITVHGPDGMAGASNPLGLAVQDKLAISPYLPGGAPTPLGTGWGVVVEAETPQGTPDTGYTGTIAIRSATDPKAAVGGGTPLAGYHYTFTSDVGQQGAGGYRDMNANDGRATLTIIPGTLGPQSYTVTDAASGASASVGVEVVAAAPAPAATPEIWSFLSEYQPHGPTVPGGYGEVAMAYDAARRRLLLLGEDNAAGPVWLSGNDGASWTQAPCGGPGLAGASMAYDDALGEVLVFGGEDVNSGRAQSAMEYADGQGCLRAASRSNAGLAPTARAYASLAYDPGSKDLVLFGGTGSRGGVWAWNGQQWSQHRGGPGPAPRQGAAFAWDGHNRKLLLFGGWDGQGTDSNDTWELDTSHWSWQRLSPAAAPPARHSGTMQWDDGYGDVLFGGAVGAMFNNQGEVTGQQLNDTWAWNGTTWRELQAADIAENATGQPGQRQGAGMAYDSRSGALVLEGGAQLLAPTATENGTAVQGENCGGCISSPEAPQNYANQGSGAPGQDLALEKVEIRLDDTWDLRAAAGREKVASDRLGNGAARVMPSPPAAETRQPLAPAPFAGYHPASLGTQASATLAAATAYRGRCPARIPLVATLGLNAPGAVFYRMQHSGEPLGPVYRLNFAAAGKQTAGDGWVIQRSGSYWARIAVSSPGILYSNVVTVQVVCQ